MSLFYWACIHSALAWTEMGPEKGHIIDASIDDAFVYVSTRVGVLRASHRMDDWERDNRFPPDTKMFDVWKEGAWAAPPGTLWEVQDTQARWVKSFSQSLVVDLDTRSDGTSFAAVRGKEQGIWITSPKGKPQRVLAELEPWVVHVHNDHVWVGSVRSGIWVQRAPNEDFQQYMTGSVTSIDSVGDRVYAAFATGEVIDLAQQEKVFHIKSGYATSLSQLKGDALFLTVGSPSLSEAPFQVFQNGQRKSLSSAKVDEDKNHLSPTKSWSLRDGRALVGTFRRGPLVWDGSLNLASKGFRATVSGGAAIDRWGQLVLALMGTGVYIWKEGEFSPHRLGGPVTDSVAVKRVGDAAVVIDFESVWVLNSSGRWMFMQGVPDRRTKRKNSLVDIGQDSEDNWWSIDSYGNVYRWQDKKWQSCTFSNVMRIDGYGEQMLFATRTGYFTPHCYAQNRVHEQVKDTRSSRALGAWVATKKHMYHNGEKIADLSGGSIQAMVRDGEGVLLAQRGSDIMYCADRCTSVAKSISDDIKALGRLPDGALWALEARGTLWKDDGSDRVPRAWSKNMSAPSGNNVNSNLYREPWLRDARIRSIAVQYLQPKFRYWWVVWSGLGVVLSLIGFGIFRRNSAKKEDT